MAAAAPFQIRKPWGFPVGGAWTLGGFTATVAAGLLLAFLEVLDASVIPLVIALVAVLPAWFPVRVLAVTPQGIQVRTAKPGQIAESRMIKWGDVQEIFLGMRASGAMTVLLRHGPSMGGQAFGHTTCELRRGWADPARLAGAIRLAAPTVPVNQGEAGAILANARQPYTLVQRQEVLRAVDVLAAILLPGLVVALATFVQNLAAVLAIAASFVVVWGICTALESPQVTFWPDRVWLRRWGIGTKNVAWIHVDSIKLAASGDNAVITLSPPPPGRKSLDPAMSPPPRPAQGEEALPTAAVTVEPGARGVGPLGPASQGKMTTYGIHFPKSHQRELATILMAYAPPSSLR